MSDDDITGNYHGGNEYSRQAFEHPGSKKQRAKDMETIRAEMIRKHVSKDPELGYSTDEMMEKTGMAHSNCSARFSDMKKKQKGERFPELVQVDERKTSHNKTAGCWTLARLLPPEEVERLRSYWQDVRSQRSKRGATKKAAAKPPKTDLFE